jgi:hypothetical protein
MSNDRCKALVLVITAFPFRKTGIGFKRDKKKENGI